MPLVPLSLLDVEKALDSSNAGCTTKEKVKAIREAMSLIQRCFQQKPQCRRLRDRPASYCFLLIVLSVIYEYHSLHIGFSTGEVSRCMVLRDGKALARVLGKMLFLALRSALLISAKGYVAETLARRMREALTWSMTEQYFGGDAYYPLSRSIDNPDQRITLDVQELSSLLVATLDRYALNPALLLYYSWQVIRTVGWKAMLGLYTFFAAGILLQRLLMPLLVRQAKKMDRLEGDYRYAHAKLRNDAEPLSLHQASGPFQKEVTYYFERLLDQYPMLLGLRFLVNLVGNCFAYAGGVANYVILYFCVDLNTYTAADMAALISQVRWEYLFWLAGA